MAVRLLMTGSVEEQWRDVAGPWLRGRQAWLDPRPTVVLTPSRAQGFYLRSRLVETKTPALGLRFWTPSDARKFLLEQRASDTRAITKTDLRLFTRMVAGRLLENQDAPDRSSLTSVLQDPEAFLRAFDLMLGAGWNPARDGADYGRALATELESELNRAQVAPQAGIHRLLRETTYGLPRPIVAALVLGFNASHWPLWDLLQAFCHACTDTVVALDSPRRFGESLDRLWVGSWENFAEAAYDFPESLAEEESTGPLQGLAASYEEGKVLEAPVSNIHFLATPDLTTQSRAIVLQTLDYLKDPDCTRLGIVFPEANALALAVSDQLRALGLPLNDGPGAFQNGLFETRHWQTWLALQEEPTVRTLVHWLRACEAGGIPSGLISVPAARAAHLLEWALNQSLIDNLDFLAVQMEKGGGDEKIVADFLRTRIALPDESTFAGYLAATREALRRLKWKDLLAELPESAPTWLPPDAPVSRFSFLAWLRETADSRERVRRNGNHFYGKIHLLLYGQLAGQSWSHLILTGLNEGVWPRLYESGAFGSRYELAALNDQVRVLNHRGVTQGRQGEGHETVIPGHGHCLLPLERHDLSLRDLCAALESTSHAVCLTALTAGGGRNLLPSDFFNHAWQAKTGNILDEVTFRDLAQKTVKRCEEHEHFFVSEKADSSQDLAAPRRAYLARRDPLAPFGPYEFAYATPPEAPIQLPCKKWENALSHPDTTWLAEIVGVSPWPEGDLNWPQAIGTWVHRWLKKALQEPSPETLLPRLREAADLELEAMRARARSRNIEPYPWWIYVWGEARSKALGLGRALAPELADKSAFSEISLPPDLLVALPLGTVDDFALSGKIDVLLVEPRTATIDPRCLNLTGHACWVIDFKTGSAKKMTVKDIEKGRSLQIVLYGLAVQALGATSTSLTLLTFDEPLSRHLTVDDLRPVTGVFRSLDMIHRRGIFGQAPSGNSEYAYQPDLPLTTRAVPPDILAAKWALVHEIPAPAPEEDA
jgi:hypothetical protein